MMICAVNEHCPLSSDNCEYYIKVDTLKHGKWIYKELWEDLDNRNFKGYACSWCNEEYEDYLFDSYELNYCPNCGAKMEV